MKKTILKNILNLIQKLFIIIDSIIELRFFKPAALSIIIIFITINGFSFIQSTLNNSNSSKYNRDQNLKRINVKIDEEDIKFDLSENQTTSYIIKPGDTILKVLLDLGAKENDIFSLLSAMKKIYDPRSIAQGNKLDIVYSLSLNVNKDNNKNLEQEISLKSLSIPLSEEEKVVITKVSDGSFKSNKVKINLVKSIERYYGTINSGLYLDGIALGLSSNAVMNMINLYSYDIDFQRDIRVGDRFEVIIEAFYSEDGKKIKDGNIIFSSISVSNRTIDMFMHKYRDQIEYFNEKGNSIKKSLLRTPINGARVSSRFGMRKHPILGYSRMHKGIDFAARRGTPILAAGDGIITYRGRKGGYGNYVAIKHNSQYSTSYAHASRFNSKFRRGSRVKQGDVIAYVGTTGRSTGPHLHFEVLKRGKHINPSKVKASSGIMLKGNDYKKFVKSRDKIQYLRKNIPNKIHIIK